MKTHKILCEDCQKTQTGTREGESSEPAYGGLCPKCAEKRQELHAVESQKEAVLQSNESTLRDKLKALLNEAELPETATLKELTKSVAKIQRHQKRLARLVLRELDSAE